MEQPPVKPPKCLNYGTDKAAGGLAALGKRRQRAAMDGTPVVPAAPVRRALTEDVAPRAQDPEPVEQVLSFTKLLAERRAKAQDTAEEEDYTKAVLSTRAKIDPSQIQAVGRKGAALAAAAMSRMIL